MYQPEVMSKENNSVLKNGHGDGELTSKTLDDEMFLFTSESVGEGHPGNHFIFYYIFIIFFLLVLFCNIKNKKLQINLLVSK